MTDKWRYSASFSFNNHQQARPDWSSPLGPQPYFLSKEDRKIRKEFREDRDARVAPSLKAAEASQAAAITIARDCLKSGVILNGGGILAAPAIITLFNLDADKMLNNLLVLALGYGLGLVAAWSASLCAFFTQAHLADQAIFEAQMITYEHEAIFYPQTRTPARQIHAESLKRKVKRLRIRFVILRYAGITSAIASLIGFGFGGWAAYDAVKNGARKVPPAIVITSPLAN